MITKQNCRCDDCGCAFVPKALTQREGEIEYSFFRCDYSGKAYLISVTDADLRKDIRKYRTLSEKHKIKPLSEQSLRELTALKEHNLKRAAKLRQLYYVEG